jgi:hypothetical protein
MTPKAMDSLEVVEMIMVVEEIFDTEIPNTEAESFGSPREIVDSLDLHLSNRRPNRSAADLLKKLAKDHDNPKLSERLDRTWRREQIAAIIREVFR